MNPQSEELREKIEDTREKLGADLSALEQEMRRTVGEATQSVREGLQRLSPRRQVEAHPVAAVGVAVAAGALAASWVKHRKESAPRRAAAALSAPSQPSFARSLLAAAALRVAGKVAAEAFPAFRDPIGDTIQRLATHWESSHLSRKA